MVRESTPGASKSVELELLSDTRLISVSSIFMTHHRMVI